ncbi:MAG: flagellar hook-basal body protein [Phycisphaerae bacterium]
MDYGLYLSAAGIQAAVHKQDVISNNLANAETVGFRRQLSVFMQRPLASSQSPQDATPLDAIGGGLFVAPSLFDTTTAPFEKTGNPLDVAIQGDAYLAVQANGRNMLTRNGELAVAPGGDLVMATATDARVLNAEGQPINLAGAAGSIEISKEGVISSNGQELGRLGTFAPARPERLQAAGRTLLDPQFAGGLRIQPATLQVGFIERSNVNPASELTEMITNARALEANANMLRFQDQTLSKVVNELGRIA